MLGVALPVVAQTGMIVRSPVFEYEGSNYDGCRFSEVSIVNEAQDQSGFYLFRNILRQDYVYEIYFDSKFDIVGGCMPQFLLRDQHTFQVERVGRTSRHGHMTLSIKPHLARNGQLFMHLPHGCTYGSYRTSVTFYIPKEISRQWCPLGRELPVHIFRFNNLPQGRDDDPSFSRADSPDLDSMASISSSDMWKLEDDIDGGDAFDKTIQGMDNI